MRRATPSTAAVDALLPQTQCTRCGYPDCAEYAHAIVEGGAAINRCPPGGDSVVDALAALTGRARLPLDPECGEHAPLAVAIVDESRCIGCTICLKVCPVDAILGAPKRMHATIEALCTGCELCVAPCPVDCIAMRPAGRDWTGRDAADARRRHAARGARIERGERVADRRPVPVEAPVRDERARRQAAVAAAVERARARRAGTAQPS